MIEIIKYIDSRVVLPKNQNGVQLLSCTRLLLYKWTNF